MNLPQRGLAITAAVALGNVGPLWTNSKTMDSWSGGKKGKKKLYLLQHEDELLRKWVGMYGAILKPKLKRGKLRFADGDGWKKRMKLMTPEMYWGGEPAGAELTGYLVPEKFTLYTNAAIPRVMKELNLLPDEKGDIEILEAFWNVGVFNIAQPNIVPPLMAYADLINDPDSRNHETAERIKRQYLEKK